MSHFSVMVIGNDVANQLAPYHEFECTGQVDEYVQSIERLEELRCHYEGSEKSMVRLISGRTVEKYDDLLYRPATSEEIERIENRCAVGLDYKRSRLDNTLTVKELPEGAEEIRLSVSQSISFEEFVKDEEGYPVLKVGEEPDLDGEHKWGWIQIDEDDKVVSVIRRTNPNSKWDWWVEGGRWSGRLLLKNGSRADSALAQDIDFDTMAVRATEKATEEFDQYCEKYLKFEEGFVQWAKVRDEMFPGEIDLARNFFNAQPLIEEYRKEVPHFWLFGVGPESFGAGTEFSVEERKQSCITLAVFGSISTYAVVKDGQWQAKGEMGWFGMSSNESSESDWSRKFMEVFKQALDENQLITIVDCHI